MYFRKLPMGIDDFRKLREEDFYYVDKTGMIAELLKGWGEVNLFTRPRRFGKSLNMSMLKCFFEPDTDKSIFDGLAICEEKELCEEYMGRYPVISLSLKQVQGLNFQDAERQLRFSISLEADRYRFLQQSERLDDAGKEALRELTVQQGDLVSAVLNLSRLLYTHYEQKVIILIDEYDVPLQKAEENGYYREMVSLISQVFGYSMKTNPYMKFAVVTGCLRVSKESIFTGFNNPKMHMVIDKEYDEWFGFTDAEVRQILADYDRSEYYDMTKEWYDGYLFGEQYVYCPWDVINWVNRMVRNDDYFPQNFWANSSGNAMIRRFIGLADQSTKDQLGELIEGKSIYKRLNFEITYDELDDSIENLWSVLFMTGYLTYKGRNEEGDFELRLPNREVKSLFKGIVDKWFSDKVMKDEEGLADFFGALDAEDPTWLEESINFTLEESISYLDGGRITEKETFYHGLMLGILSSRQGWLTKSNREAGLGRLDIATYPRRGKNAIIFELKYVSDYKQLDGAAEAALKQIENCGYDRYFESRTPDRVIHYGIAFCKKRCRVLIKK